MASPKDPKVITLKTTTPVGNITISAQTNNPPINFKQAAKRILAKRNQDAMQSFMNPWEGLYVAMFCLASFQSLYWQSIAESYAKQISYLHSQTKSAV